MDAEVVFGMPISLSSPLMKSIRTCVLVMQRKELNTFLGNFLACEISVEDFPSCPRKRSVSPGEPTHKKYPSSKHN